jgi:hypothetical protein
VTLSEAFRLFDWVEHAELEWFTINGERVGVPRDCGVPVIFDSSDGTAKIRCGVCGLQVAEIAGRWVVMEWGKRGVRLPKGGD